MPISRPPGRVSQGEAEINGHLAFLLFFRPVRVNPGEGGYECRFAVVTWPAVPITRMGPRKNLQGAARIAAAPLRIYQVL